MTGEQIKALPRSPISWVDLRLRPGLRLQITLPYIMLAVLLAIGGALVISQLIVDSVQERFVNQLLETGRLAANRVVEVEQETLATLRIVASERRVLTLNHHRCSHIRPFVK